MRECRIKGWGAISQEDARELERQQFEALKKELKLLSPNRDKERIAQIKARLRAIERISNSGL